MNVRRERVDRYTRGERKQIDEIWRMNETQCVSPCFRGDSCMIDLFFVFFFFSSLFFTRIICQNGP